MLKKLGTFTLLFALSAVSVWCLQSTVQSVNNSPTTPPKEKSVSLAPLVKDNPNAESTAPAPNTKTGPSNQSPAPTVATNNEFNPPFSASPGTISATARSEGQPVSGVWITALRKSDYKLAASAETDSNGVVELTVSPGEYYIYVVDREGRFVSGFNSDSPQPITVTANAVTSVNVAATAAKGTIRGQVTDKAGNPIPGAWITIMTTTPENPGFPKAVITADSNGNFTSDLLEPGSYFVGWIDPSGKHQALFAPNSPSVPGSTPVTVSAGQTSIASGALPPMPASEGSAVISGTVTSSQGGAIAGARVVALHATTLMIASGTTTNVDGDYSLALPAGEYKMAFIDSNGLHDPEWHSNVPINNLEAAASVSAPGVVQATLQANTGSLSGTISDGTTNQPLPGTWVMLANDKGPVRGTVADANGAYTIDQLKPGEYFITVVDPQGARVANPLTNDSSQVNISGAVTITAGQAADRNLTLSGPLNTFESRMGQPLEEFPFTIMIEPPHRPHFPVTDFAQTLYNATTGYEFILPEETSEEGLYGRHWLSPEPPTPGALLAGVRFNNASWEGVCSNSIVVFSLLDRHIENNAPGSVTGAIQGLPNELVGVIFEQHSNAIEMRLNQPVAYSANRFVAAIDAESLPMDQPTTIFPDKISVGSIEWLWTTP